MIDLGEVNHAAPEHAAPLDHRRIRRALLAVAAIAGLLLAGGSARPAAPSGLRLLWSTTMTGTDAPAYGPDTVYLLRAPELTAYDLATGAIRWQVPIRDARTGAEPAGDVVLLRTGQVVVEQEAADGEQRSFEFSRFTVALSARTGAEIWRTGGETIVQDGGTALFEERDERGNLVRLRLRRLTDGTTIWTRPFRGTWAVTEDADGRPAQIITTDSADEVTVFRYADATLLHRGRLPGASDPETGLAGMHDLLAHVRSDPTGITTTTTFYRLADMTRLWQHTDSGYGIRICGPLVCVVGEGGLTAHDLATGRELWRRPGMRWVWPAGPGRLLADDGDFVHQLIDAATGRPVGPPARGQRLFNSASAGFVLVLRSTTDPVGLQSVTRLDLTTGAQTLLGAIDPVHGDQGCWSEGRYLACPVDGKLLVRVIGRP